FFFFSSRRRHTRFSRDWSSDVCSSDLGSWKLLNASASDGKHLSVTHVTRDGTVYAEQDDGKAPPAIGTLDLETGTFTPLFQDKRSEERRVGKGCRSRWPTDQ